MSGRATACAAPGRGRGAALPRTTPTRRGRRGGRVLPAPRRARGLRPAARSRRHDHDLAADLRGVGGRRRWRSPPAGARGVRRPAAMTETAPTTDSRSSSRRSGHGRSPVYFFAGGVAGASAALASSATRGAAIPRSRGVHGALRSPAIRQPGAARLRPRAPRALSQHAADVQDHLADERRLLDPDGGWARPRSPRCTRSPAAPRASAAPPAARRRPRPAARTYTGALLANTAVPVWHEARWSSRSVRGGRRLSAGAVAVVATPVELAAPARRLAIGAAVGESRDPG